MRDEYVAVFMDIVRETESTTGYTLPEDVKAYISILLGEYMDRTHFIPDRAYAEVYLSLTKKQYHAAKELADNCLFLTGVFPGYANRYMGIEYFSNIGRNSYSQAAQGLNRALFETMCVHFDFIREFVELTTSQPSVNKIKIMDNR